MGRGRVGGGVWLGDDVGDVAAAAENRKAMESAGAPDGHEWGTA